MAEIRHKVNTLNPTAIIELIEAAHPELKGVVYYENKQLLSRNHNYLFDFDPYHAVITIYTYGLPYIKFEEIKVP